MVTFRPNIYVPLDRVMVILQLCVAGSFHIKHFVADFIRLELNFIHKKTKNMAFQATIWGGIWGNIGTPPGSTES